MTKFAEFLISLADQLDSEGKSEQADVLDNDFEEFLEMLENGELEFNNLFSGGQRPPRDNRGTEMPIFGIPGPQ